MYSRKMRKKDQLRSPRVRLLPLVVVVAGLMVTVRIGNVWTGVSQGLEKTQTPDIQIGTPKAYAQDAAEEPVDTPAEDPATQPPAAAAEANATEDPREVTDLDLMNGDAISFTKAELETLQRLAERREQLENREKQLAQRESLLIAAEQKINRRIAEMETLKQEIEVLVKSYNQQKNAEAQRLVKIYESMKPKDAARIFNSLEMDVLRAVLNRMSERKAAAVMSYMDSMVAKAVTEDLAEQRTLPGEGL
jgi:flagellar motility protein MotE (MotC chaperone)